MEEADDSAQVLTSRDAYNAGVQIYNQEFTTVSGKTNAFLIVQSILIAAFVTMTCYKQSFPMAYDVLALAIISLAVLHCLLHHRAGRSGADAAFRWRRYLLDQEGDCLALPLTWFRNSCEGEYHRKESEPWYSAFTCEACLFERIPLPNAWLFTPSLFVLWWVLASLYVELNYWLARCHPSLLIYHQSPQWLFIICSLVALALLVVTALMIKDGLKKWWASKRE